MKCNVRFINQLSSSKRSLAFITITFLFLFSYQSQILRTILEVFGEVLTQLCYTMIVLYIGDWRKIKSIILSGMWGLLTSESVLLVSTPSVTWQSAWRHANSTLRQQFVLAPLQVLTCFVTSNARSLYTLIWLHNFLACTHIYALFTLTETRSHFVIDLC